MRTRWGQGRGVKVEGEGAVDCKEVVGMEAVSVAVGSSVLPFAGEVIDSEGEAEADTGLPRVMGVLFVGALLMCSVMRVGTDSGVTLSIMVKAGNNNTVVGSE